MQKLEIIHFAGCLVNLVYGMYPQEGHSPSECLASYRSLQEQFQTVPNCVILVPLLGLIESTKLILTCDSNKRFEDLSLEIFLSEWKRDSVSLWYRCSYFAAKCLVFTLWKKMTLLEIPPNYFSFIYFSTYECETLESCNYHYTHSSSSLHVLMKKKKT